MFGKVLIKYWFETRSREHKKYLSKGIRQFILRIEGNQ